jgi:hypothetical protein
VPTNPGGVAPGLDVHIRRAVWIAWGVTMVVASFLYALKAAEDRSAFVRWRHQVLEIGQGVDIWHDYYFPNPPILPLTLYPLMLLPPVAGAMAWYAIKVGFTTWSALALGSMARGRGARLAPWAFGLVLLLSLRPILSDLQHGNINLLILFLIVASLRLWRARRDGAAGMVLALAIAYKVTPALFVPYFLYKRSWKLVASTMVGLVLFLFVVPGGILGPRFNWQCLMSWRHNIISPFVEGETIASVQEVNQSMPGVLTRLLTAPKVESDRELTHGNGQIKGDLAGLNLADWDPERVALLAKGFGLAFVGLLGWLCRTRTSRRDDPRLLGEFGLVVLTMLFVSERSWKHHYVTVLLPYTYLVYQAVAAPATRRVRAILVGSLAFSALLMASSSSDLSDLVAGEGAHEVALYYGLFFWSAVVIFVAAAWRVRAEGRREAAWDESPAASPIPTPHLERAGERSRTA